jgi:hypothetical protein
MTSRAVIVTVGGQILMATAADRRPGSCRVPVAGRQTGPQISGDTSISAIAQQR